MTTKPSIALADLLEKGADTDLLREMISHIVERVMQFDVENLCAAGYGERSPDRQRTVATATASGSGRRAPAPLP